MARSEPRHSFINLSVLHLFGGRPFARTSQVRNFLSERRRQVDLMILFVNENLPDLLRERVFAERFALTDTFPVVAYGLVFIVRDRTEASLWVCRKFGLA